MTTVANGRERARRRFAGRFVRAPFLQEVMSYFGWDSERKRCRIKHTNGCSEQPRFIVVVAVPEETPFEAPALEEFLIREFRGQLPDNTAGQR